MICKRLILTAEGITLQAQSAVTSPLEPVLQSRIEPIQDKLVDCLHNLQSVVQEFSQVGELEQCIARVQEAIRFLTTDEFSEDEIIGPVNWELFGERLLQRRSEAK